MIDLPEIVKQKLAALPNKPGVYRYFDKNGTLIYVGKAKNLKRRVNSYFNKEQTGKTRVLVSKIADLEYSIVDSESEALLLENTMIKQYKPRYNIMLKDDKTYPWICIKKEAFPRVFLTRRKVNDGSEYFGPYPSVRTAHILLDLLSQVYKVRSCRTPLTEAGVEKGKYKVCLDYHIHKCNGPCEGLISKEDYNAMISEIREVIKGNLGWVLRGLKSAMMEYASRMEFEEAQIIKEKYDLLEEYRSRSTVVSATIHNVEVFSYVDEGESFYVNYMKVKDGAVPMKLDYPMDEVQLTVPQRGDKLKLLDLSRRNAMQYKIDLEKQLTLVDPERHQKRVLNSLKEALQLEVVPEVIECFDNSNFQGDYAVAGMVQFVNGKPNKAGYRHFNIKTVEGPDDYASMKEVVRRRYSRLIDEDKPLPNLIITDGGKGQMEVVRQVIQDELHVDIPIAGLAKDDRHRTNELLFGFPPRVVGLKPNSEVFRLLAHIQDEVHRFAITFHRKKFEKGFMHSELADIKGIGKKTAEKLLLELKSVKGIREASLERLTEIVGPAKAEIVHNYFAVETH